MFQEKDIEAYQSIKAPVELKNRTRLSVELQKKKNRKQVSMYLATAACIALLILPVALQGKQNSILSIENKTVSFEAVQLEHTIEPGLAAAAEGRSSDLQIKIPMEINVEEKSHIMVSEGVLQKMEEANVEAETVTEMDIAEKSVIYWTIQGNTDVKPVCTVVMGEKKYTYVVVYDEDTSVFIIKQTN